MMKKRLLSIIIFAFLISLSMGALVHATAPTNASNSETEESVKTNTPIIPKPDFLPGPDPKTTAEGANTQDYILNTTIPRIINIVIALLAIAAFIGLIIAAIGMLTAYGNEDKYNKAKKNIQYSLYGFVLVILSYAIVSIVVSLALPSDDDKSDVSSVFAIPSAYAVNVNKDVDILFPKESDLIQDQGDGREVSLPSGDFLTEIVPAAITNIFYMIGFLILIAFLVAGVLLISGRGNEETVTKAKRIITYAIIAIALLSLGYALIFGIATFNLTQEEDNAEEYLDESFDLYVSPEEE